MLRSHHTSPTGARALSISLLCVCASAAAGCNGIFGIEAPDNAVLFDSGTPAADEPEASRTPDGSVIGDQDGSGGAPPTITIDGGVDSVVPDDGHWATWPMPNPVSTGLDHVQSYRVSPDGFVTDEITHLEWQQTIDDNASSWQDASNYCDDLALDGGGFRLPTRIELLSLLDFTAENPSIDSATFPDTPSAFFWSSSRFVSDKSLAWVVNFGAAPAFLSSSELNSAFQVRCVRTAADAPRRQFAVDNGTVLDSATQLVWQRAASATTYDFAHAATYCKALDLDGTGWRLPTIKELPTLIDETRAMPSIDPKAFPKTEPDFFWTASAVAGVAGQAWAVSFRFGFDAAFENIMEQHVRCVR